MKRITSEIKRPWRWFYWLFSRCRRCNCRGAETYHQNTSYCKYEMNIVTLCPECQEENDETPKPCPKCQSNNLEVDADGMATSLKGIDYQNIWVECLDCGFNHGINTCDYPGVDRMTQLCVYQWNRIPVDSGER